MSAYSGWDMYVFRSGRQCVQSELLVEQLAKELACLGAPDEASRESCLRVFLRCAEVEGAIADCGAGWRDCEAAFARLTDGLVEATLGGSATPQLTVPGLPLPPQLRVSIPEGFGYYALHPFDFFPLLDSLPELESALVVGIRTIGTALSAILTGELRRRGVFAARMTVRPEGDPFAREVAFSEPQRRLIEGHATIGSQFLVVDEGPGASGSSFLCTGEALEHAGVPRGCIHFLGTAASDPEKLLARDGGARWRRFRSLTTARTRELPRDAEREISGGRWRELAYAKEGEWPGAWLQMERLKFLSARGKTLFKFEGLGPYGDFAWKGAQSLAAAGLGPHAERAQNGFVAYEWLPGRPMCAQDLNDAVIARLAEYCALRVREFPAEHVEVSEVELMARKNLALAFPEHPIGLEALRVERPVVPDARMLPHEWILTKDGLVVKADACSHGNDHLLPGPADIAWDLAGAICEWRMSREQEQEFLLRYRELTEDDAGPRMHPWQIAYAAFRMGYCRLAAEMHRNLAAECARLMREFGYYRERLGSQLAPMQRDSAAA